MENSRTSELQLGEDEVLLEGDTGTLTPLSVPVLMITSIASSTFCAPPCSSRLWIDILRYEDWRIEKSFLHCRVLHEKTAEARDFACRLLTEDWRHCFFGDYKGARC